MPLVELKANESVNIGKNISVTAIDVPQWNKIKIWVEAPCPLKIVSPKMFKYTIKNGNYNIEDMKYFLIKKALKETNNNIAKAGCLLGITGRGLHNILERYREKGFDVPPKRKAYRPRKSA